ncbi:PGC-1 and ERR-induced regulator in muscle protein 1 [Cheilinus undulatus]|uniref:PGC-1 and ERR-induced regulator in muscle protein 1 n=1 Tax=Cheilinus undulatus TaxID=241271 RepID=UPI001BD2457B|nr:PGC-1 and ERR-induced regulator in muscle protein 1 [Cheilinus undulatus]
MEDFEYSVEICDRDWECFFAECEECNLLPPSIASLDDSGMSDFDNSRSVLARRVQKVDLKASLSETDCLIDGPPDCEGSPVEHYLSKHGISGMESVLSGSEEDLHLQSVNVFFEGLKNGTEAERPTEPSQVRIAQNSEEKQEEEKCSDGHHESRRALPKKSPKLNCLPASGETAVGKETTGPVETISSNTMKTRKNEQFSPNTFPEPVASNSIFFTNKSDHSELFIRDKAGAVKTNEETQGNQSNVSQDGDVCAETTTHIDKVEKLDVSTSQEDIMQEPKQFILSKKGSTDLWSNVDILTNVKWRDDQNPNVLQTDTLSLNKTVSQESSPSASMKRKRRKKRRLSVEPAGSVHGYERQVLVKQSDSEEEHCLWRGGTGLCTSEGFSFSYLNQPQKMILPSLTPYSATNNLPIKISSNGITVNDFTHYIHPCVCQYQNLQESIARHASSMENNAYNDKTVIPLCPNSNCIMTAQSVSGNTATDLKPSCELQREESAGPNKCPGLSVSITDLVTGTSSPAGSFWRDGEMTQSSIYCENEHNPALWGSEVTSVTNSILPSTESNDPAVDVCQNDKLSPAKSVLALEAGKCGRNKHTLCRREAEPQQQLEINCHFTDQYSCTMGKTQSPLTAISTSSSDAQDTKQEPIKTTACPSVKEISSQIDCDKITLDGSNSLSDECFLSKSAPSLNGNMTVKHTNPPLVLSSKSKFSFLLDKEPAAGNTEITPQILSFHSGDPVPYGEMNQKGKEETELSMPEELVTSPFYITPGSSCGTHDTESIVSFLNTNIIDVSGGSPLSVCHHDSVEEKTSLLLVKHETGDITCTPKSHSVSEDTTGSNCDLEEEAEDAPTASVAECEPEKAPEHPVFAMSSFWNEMEKLTINDILGLRNISKATPSSSLPPLQEIEETDMLAMTDSGFFNQLDESKPEQTIEDTYNNLNNAGLSSSSALEVHSSLSKTVLWENEHVTLITASDVYPKNKILTSVSDIPEPVPPGSAQTCLRKISKNISVHNLPALESQPFSHRWKNQTLQMSDKGQLEKVENFSNGNMKFQDKDCLAPSSSYKISLTDIFQYLFGEQKPITNQSTTDNITSHYTDGNSVSENYDHFFSDFDTDSFFYPLITAEDQAKDKPVPIFSCSRSANRNIQYPEAYEFFFASSSSDDSSDDEENCGPVRVVTRFSRTPSSSRICKDMYENFFTDRDLKQNFFWKNTLSFRNRSFAVQKQTLSNPLSSEPLKQSKGPSQKTVHSVNALENHDIMISDPLRHYLEDRISRQLAQMAFRCENLQMAVSSPRLDAPLLPLRHSDMCLLCIAFASWVMKTSDPQAGDAWKAVLLANVSALSAIRYLRKYIRMEATSSENKVHCSTPSF